jgi:hypothetical protein
MGGTLPFTRGTRVTSTRAWLLLCISVLLVSSCSSEPGGLGSLFGDSGNAPGGPAGGLKAGTDWESVRRVENVAWSIDKDPAVSRLTPLVKKNPAENLRALVDALVAGKKDDFERVRAIHDWIARNIAYDWSAYQDKSPTIVDPFPVLTHGSSICYGYAQLFSLMCSMAGIKAQIVEGYGRGIGFDPYTEDSQPYQSQHAWNAVLIDGGWYFVDATWDAGAIDQQKNDFVWRYSTGYLFTPPEIFLCTHFPDDARWQLRETPMNLAQLRSQPMMVGEFGKRGLQLGGSTTRVMTAAAEQEIVLRAPPSVHLRGFLSGEGLSPLQSLSQVAVRRDGDTVHLTTMFPAAGRYSMSLSAYAGDDESTQAYVGALYFIATEGSQRRAAYIISDTSSSGLSIEAAGGYVYRVGSSASIAFSGRTDAFVMLQDKSGQPLEGRISISRDGERQVATCAFPRPGEYTVTISVPSKTDAHTWTGVATLTFEAQAGSDLEFPAVTERGRRAGVVPSNSGGYNPRVGGEARVSFRFTGSFMASLYDGRDFLQGRTFVQSNADRKTVRVSFPKPGEYTLYVSVPTEKPNSWEGAVSFHFIASASSGPFPVVYAGGTDAGFQVISPLQGELKSGQDVAFEIAGPVTGSVFVSVGNKRVPLQGADGRFRGTIRAAGSPLTVFCSVKEGAVTTALAQYTVR